LLVGGDRENSDDNVSTVIAAAVAVPIAVVAVVGIIGIILVVGVIMRRRASMTGVVQFEPTDGLASIEDANSL
jgi:hypothetical protein